MTGAVTGIYMYISYIKTGSVRGTGNKSRTGRQEVTESNMGTGSDRGQDKAQ